MTTKEQERKALEKIRKIVDELGEGSYIATAFEGCFDLAESNIEYDFGESMKDRADSCQKKVEDLTKELKEVYRELEKADAARQLSEKKLEATEKSYDKLQYELAKTRGELQQAAEFIENAKKVYTRRIGELERMMLSAADTMENFADRPQDIAYGAALKHYRTYRAERDNLRAELTKLDSKT